MRGFRFVFGLFAVVFAGLPAFASSPSADVTHLHVQLVVPTDLVAGQQAQAGLYFKLEQGWHIYWKNAGDSGEPPRIHWTLPDGITADELEFPAPKRLPLGPLMDFGYEDEVFFPIALHTAANAKPGAALLDAKAGWLVCREVCIPGKAELQVSRKILAAGAGFDLADKADGDLLQRFQNKLPVALPATAKAVFAPSQTGFKLAILTGQRESSAQFFPSEQNILENPAPQTATPVANGVLLELKKDATLAANARTDCRCG